MKTYSCYDAPLKVFGVPFFDTKKKLERVPQDVREKIPSIEFLGRRCPGARVGFRTDAEEFTVRITINTLAADIGMSIYACQSFSVMIGDRQNAVFAGLVCPPDYETKVFEKTFKKSRTMEEVTLWFMRNEEVSNVEVIVPDEATVISPTPYKQGKALFYGSSITEGAACSGATTNYTAILSRWLDMDYYNFGFSGSAKGELEMADYINTIDMSVFIMDYDHNAPTAEHLAKTHEPFFKRIREKHPHIPVLFMTRPDFDYAEDGVERREIIRRTYQNAVDCGDENVYFIDGETFFGKEDRQLCLVDMIHPNNLGAYRMAKTIEPTLKKLLNMK